MSQPEADSVQKPAKGKWSKVNGRWNVAKKVSFDLIKKPDETAQEGHSKKKQEDITEPLPEQEPEHTASTPTRGWQFGKVKTFTRHLSNPKNNAAACLIQKMALGGMQRLKYRIALLQHKLDRKDELTASALDEVHKRLQSRKEKCLKKIKAKAAAANDEASLGALAVMESQRVISFLRKENKQIRQQNNDLAEKIHRLRTDNKRIKEASKRMDFTHEELKEHTKYLQDTNEKLKDVSRQYVDSIEQVTEALDVRQSYCLAEHTVKVNYVKCVGSVVEMMQERCDEDDLVDEVVSYCLEIGAGDSSSDEETTK